MIEVTLFCRTQRRELDRGSQKDYAIWRAESILDHIYCSTQNLWTVTSAARRCRQNEAVRSRMKTSLLIAVRNAIQNATELEEAHCHSDNLSKVELSDTFASFTNYDSLTARCALNFPLRTNSSSLLVLECVLPRHAPLE